MEFVGIYGGTFDPIHSGHLRSALEVAQDLRLKRVDFVPCYQPVHRSLPMASDFQRAQMIELAIATIDKFYLNRIEIDSKQPAYMIETLSKLKNVYVDDSLVLMLGSDAFANLEKWKNYLDILNLANIVVMVRPQTTAVPPKSLERLLNKTKVNTFSEAFGQTMLHNVTQLDISATNIRRLHQQGKLVNYLQPQAVRHYILDQQLYQNKEKDQ